MGSSSSKFKKALLRGQEVSACHLYLENPDLKDKIDPNASYGETHSNLTALHFAAKHGIKLLLGDFLSKGGNPNKTDSTGKTSLHHLMIYPSNSMAKDEKNRLECFELLSTWSRTGSDGLVERINFSIQDSNQNTPLHYASASGLFECVKKLISHGAPLFHENAERKTACDLAEANDFQEIASFLEAKMVFQDDLLDVEEFKPDENAVEQNVEYRSVSELDLQEIKDQLIVETADMLKVPLFTAEVLLSNHDWSRVDLLESWMLDRKVACQNAGINDVDLDEAAATISSSPLISNRTSEKAQKVDDRCVICEFTKLSMDQPVDIPCGHLFCRNCLQLYLSSKITNGRTQNIQCPAFDCSSLIPVEITDKLISRELAFKYLKFDIKAFVETNPNLKWCPEERCLLAIRLNESTHGSPVVVNQSRSVACRNGHFFCWDCNAGAHDPCSCDTWQKWQKEVQERAPKKGISEVDQTEDIANKLWMTSNSKECPNCRAHIQKNEGCNHMFCLKCKHDFCWVCLGQWRLHNTSTGGYFRCNRYDAVEKVQKKIDVQREEAEKESKTVSDTNRFLHYYTRYDNHGDSFQIEKDFMKSIKNKMKLLKKTSRKMLKLHDVDVSFLSSGMEELLKARLVLRGSYPFGYYMEDDRGQRTVYEFMQDELEQATENLSQMIARAYCKSPRSHVIKATHKLSDKRREFMTAISRGLIPIDDLVFSDSFSSLQLASPERRTTDRITFVDETSDPNNLFLQTLHLNDTSVSSSGLEFLLGLGITIDPDRTPTSRPNSESTSPRRRAWASSDSTEPRLRSTGFCSKPGCTNTYAIDSREDSDRQYCITCRNRYDQASPRRRIRSHSPVESDDLQVDSPVGTSFSTATGTRKVHVAQFDYTPIEDDELELKVGDVVTILREVDQGWLRGSVGTRTGIFPSAFIVELNDEVMRLDVS